MIRAYHTESIIVTTLRCLSQLCVVWEGPEQASHWADPGEKSALDRSPSLRRKKLRTRGDGVMGRGNSLKKDTQINVTASATPT